MDKTALINRQLVNLSEREYKAAAQFHKKRYAFAWLSNIPFPSLVFNDTPNDDRDHRQWLRETYGISDEEFESTLRGYMMMTDPDERIGKIQLFMGSSFLDIPDDRISTVMRDLLVLRDKYKEKFINNPDYQIFDSNRIDGRGDETYGSSPLHIIKVFNGVYIGPIGAIWQPKKFLLELYL